MNYTHLIGIDPDKHGAWSLWDTIQNVCVTIVDMPTEIEFFGVPSDGNTVAYLEKGVPLPTDGKKSAASFWYRQGWIKSTLAQHAITCVEVAPYTWKGRFGLNRDQLIVTKNNLEITYQDMKKAAVDYLTHNHPEVAKLAGGIHGRAEAALIGLYGLRKELRSLPELK